jgi:hypothetical protein
VFQIELNTTLSILGAATHGRGAWEISPVTATATTVAPAAGQYSDVVTLQATVTPAGVTGTVQFLVNAGAIPGSATYNSVTGIATQSYTIPLGQGGYTIQANFTSTNSLFANSSGSNTLTVTRENAVVTPNAANPTAVKVPVAGGNSGPMSLVASIVEVADGSLGDISKAVPVTCTLTPAGVGSAIPTTAVTSGGGVGGTLTATCNFTDIPVNVYTVTFNIGGNFYTGSAVSLLTVYDPSLGFVTGGGEITNPNTGFPASFGFTMKFLKNGNTQGNLVYVEHRPTGDVILKSNAVGPLAIVGNQGVVTGRATLSDAGGYTFVLNVVDNGEPGSADLFGLQVQSGGVSVPALTFAPVILDGGNIQVPH